MLGELYKPKGLARETAQAVLEVDEPYAVNVALGCPNGCKFCYGPKAIRKSKEAYVNMRQPKRFAGYLVWIQLGKILEHKKPLPMGVFASFLTDPFLEENKPTTNYLAKLFDAHGIKFATLSKVGLSNTEYQKRIRHGISIATLDLDFWKKWTPNVLELLHRIILLRDKHLGGCYTWVSMEPYPVSAIWKQPIEPLLEELKFVDLIVFGKWNYDKRANTEQARIEYAQDIEILRDFCKSNRVRLHIKSDTLKFVGGKQAK